MTRQRRRTVLLSGLVAITAAGCDIGGGQVAPIVTTRPLEPVALDAQRLVASYDVVLEAHSDLAESISEIRDNHAAHLAALTKFLGTAAPTGSGPVDGDLDGAPLETLIDAENDTAESALNACVESGPEFAVVLGEIVACRTSHVYLLGTMK